MPAGNSFNELIHLTDREIKILIREVDQKDLICSLKGTRKDLRDKFLNNMSERVRRFIEEEIKLVKPKPEEVKKVRESMVQQIVQLAEKGRITWPPVEKPTSRSKTRRQPSKKDLAAYRRLKQQVQRHPLTELSYDKVNILFVSLSEISRREGIAALENVAQDMLDPFLKDAVQLVVDGTEPGLIMDILETWMESLLHEQKRKYQKVIEGAMAIQAGDNPRIVEHKLEVIY